MRRVMAGLSVILVGLAAFTVVVTGTWGVVLAVSAVGAALWRFGRCHHKGPLGLLPPTLGDDGVLQPARWFCDACGKDWPAVFERAQRPIQRFDGYDPSKAINAARRAEELSRRQRSLAMRRAGFEQPPRRAPQLRPEVAEVVAIGERRRFAK